jgi:hypothetical protein
MALRQWNRVDWIVAGVLFAIIAAGVIYVTTNQQVRCDTIARSGSDQDDNFDEWMHDCVETGKARVPPGSQ